MDLRLIGPDFVTQVQEAGDNGISHSNSSSHEYNDFRVEVHVFHFPSRLSPGPALVMPCLRINFVGPPSAMLFCGSRKLYAELIFIFDVIERHLKAVVQLPSEPFSQCVIFAHSRAPFLTYREASRIARAALCLQLSWGGAPNHFSTLMLL